MEIILNNQPKEFPENASVQHLMDEMFPEKQKGIAVAVNFEVIQKTLWSQHLLQPKDEIIIIRATQGG